MLSFADQTVCGAVLGSFLFGFHVSALNVVMPSVARDLGWCEGDFGPMDRCNPAWRQALVTSIMFFGAIVGCIAAGRLADWVGRRFCLLCAHALFSVGNAVTALSPSAGVLAAGRIITGVAVGGVTVLVPLYVLEMARPGSRGRSGVMSQLLITLGIFMAIALGQFSMQSDNWRRVFWVAQLPALVGLLVFGFWLTDETPHFYVLAYYRGATNPELLTGAEAVLLKIHQGDARAAARHFGIIRKSILIPHRTASQGGTTSGAIAPSSFSSSSSPSGSSLFMDCSLSRTFRATPTWCAPQHRRVMAVGLCLSATQQLTGINVFISVSTSLFVRAGLPEHQAGSASLAMAAIGVLCTLPAAWWIDLWGRRRLLLVGLSGQAFSLLPAGVLGIARVGVNLDTPAEMKSGLIDARSFVPVAGVILFVVFFSVGLGPVPAVYLNEIFPGHIKASASSACFALNWASCCFAVTVAQLVSAEVAFSLFAVLSLAGFVPLRRTLSFDLLRKPDVVISHQGEALAAAAAAAAAETESESGGLTPSDDKLASELVFTSQTVRNVLFGGLSPPGSIVGFKTDLTYGTRMAIVFGLSSNVWVYDCQPETKPARSSSSSSSSVVMKSVKKPPSEGKPNEHGGNEILSPAASMGILCQLAAASPTCSLDVMEPEISTENRSTERFVLLSVIKGPRNAVPTALVFGPPHYIPFSGRFLMVPPPTKRMEWNEWTVTNTEMFPRKPPPELVVESQSSDEDTFLTSWLRLTVRWSAPIRVKQKRSTAKESSTDLRNGVEGDKAAAVHSVAYLPVDTVIYLIHNGGYPESNLGCDPLL